MFVVTPVRKSMHTSLKSVKTSGEAMVIMKISFLNHDPAVNVNEIEEEEERDGPRYAQLDQPRRHGAHGAEGCETEHMAAIVTGGINQ